MYRTKKKIRCSDCALKSSCIPKYLSSTEIIYLDELLTDFKDYKKGQILFYEGQAGEAVYSIRAGTTKEIINDRFGNQQIISFNYPGSLIGISSRLQNYHSTTVIAIEDVRVCVISKPVLELLDRKKPSWIRKSLANEINYSYKRMLELGCMSSTQKVAIFLIDHAVRVGSKMGDSSSEFSISMNREDIGNYLGLTLETVSRVFSRLTRDRIISQKNKRIRILSLIDLERFSEK